MSSMLAVLKGADPQRVSVDQLPRIPGWWPLQPADSPPLDERERMRRRYNRAVREATTGPYDGQRFVVETDEQRRPPRVFTPLGRRDVRYLLDTHASTHSVAVYRYDPGCPFQVASMRAVEAAFDEVGPAYTHASREDDPR